MSPSRFFEVEFVVIVVDNIKVIVELVYPETGKRSSQRTKTPCVQSKRSSCTVISWVGVYYKLVLMSMSIELSFDFACVPGYHSPEKSSID